MMRVSSCSYIAAMLLSSSFQVSSVGVTGTRESVNEKVQSLLQQIKEATSKPVAVGFGISKPEHVKQVGLHHRHWISNILAIGFVNPTQFISHHR